MMQQFVEINPQRSPVASVIWLHGLGADGHDFETIVPLLNLPEDLQVRFIFPHAPMRPVTLNNGYVMRAWFDIKEIGLNIEVDQAGIQTSEKVIHDLIVHETQEGIPVHRIILAGFSQGGGVALYAGLRYSERLGGILALSTYLPGVEELITSASVVNQSVPIMMAHGTMDSLIPLQMAKKTFLRLKEGGYEIEFHTYPMGHGMCEEEIHDISKWIQNIFDSTFIRDLAPTA